MNPQTEPVGRAGTVRLFEAEILRMRALWPLPEGAAVQPGMEEMPGDRVQISDAARLLAALAASDHAESRAALQNLFTDAPDGRLAAFLQAYGGLYGVDFLAPPGAAGEAYDRTGRRDVREALRRELLRYARENGGGAAEEETAEEEAACGAHAGLRRWLAALRRRLRRLLHL